MITIVKSVRERLAKHFFGRTTDRLMASVDGTDGILCDEIRIKDGGQESPHYGDIRPQVEFLYQGEVVGTMEAYGYQVGKAMTLSISGMKIVIPIELN